MSLASIFTRIFIFPGFMCPSSSVHFSWFIGRIGDRGLRFVGVLRDDAQSVSIYIVFGLIAAMLWAIAPLTCAADLTTVDVAERLKISVPSDWRIRDGARRQAIADAAASATRTVATHVASFSAISPTDPVQAIVRASILNRDTGQDQFNQTVGSSQARVLAEVRAQWEAEQIQLTEALAKVGMRLIGQADHHIDIVGGKTAVVTSYRRASVAGGASFLVTMFRVPLRSEMILLTFSYQESRDDLKEVLWQIKDSVMFYPN